ncbi:hypothetical protein [Cellulophaga sp. Z1A5H]|uniref:hypothetical protein n=1 Tax=Cellulophaga sp. Z1A5H TaxID=2687291 RepID=UPI0013FD1F2B|nr:hypothetical protein [Cellulophaga sp. Z1A5H]
MRLLDKLVVLTVGFFTLLGSAQQAKDSTTLPTAIEDINSSNVVDYISSKVKVYDKNPMYAIRPLQNSCVYEVLINDHLAYKNYDLQKLATPILINHYILKSGIQTITYRLYPLGDLMVDTYGKGETINSLLKNTSMNIEVIKYEDVKTGTQISDEISIKSHESLTKKGTREFIGSGLPYYEYTFTFKATVPYEIEGWSNGEDLTKYDKEELEAVVLKKYAQIKQLYLEKNIDKLVQIEYLDKSLREDISDYKDKETIKEYWDNYYADVILQDKRYQPLEGYKMQFFGNNKIVTLRHPVTAPIDPRLKGKAALYFLNTEDSGRIIATFTGVSLFLPRGRPLTVENLKIL